MKPVHNTYSNIFFLCFNISKTILTFKISPKEKAFEKGMGH
jgi:hypothetical protein